MAIQKIGSVTSATCQGSVHLSKILRYSKQQISATTTVSAKLEVQLRKINSEQRSAKKVNSSKLKTKEQIQEILAESEERIRYIFRSTGKRDWT